MLSTATARPLGALLQRQGLRGLAAAASSPQIMKGERRRRPRQGCTGVRG